MVRIVKVLLLFGVSVFTLTSCALFQNDKEQNQAAVCKELNHRIIFNGATADPSAAMQQRAEMDTLTKDYRTQGCG
jgi:hypothetical protein